MHREVDVTISELTRYLTRNNGFYVLNLTPIKTSKRLTLRHSTLYRLIISLANMLNTKYLLVKSWCVNGRRGCKIYFFNDLEHPLAKTLLESNKVRIINVNNFR